MRRRRVLEARLSLGGKALASFPDKKVAKAFRDEYNNGGEE